MNKKRILLEFQTNSNKILKSNKLQKIKNEWINFYDFYKFYDF